MPTSQASTANLALVCALGCLFGPLLTKWLGLLNRIQVKSPVKSVIYKVRASRPGYVCF